MHQSALSSSTDSGCDAVDPGQRGGDTTITVTYYQAPTQTSGSPEYSVLETFQLTRPRSDRPRTVSTGAGRAATVTAR
jgi:hypothetical protein